MAFSQFFPPPSKVRDPCFSGSFHEFNLSVAGSVIITEGDKNVLTNVMLLGSSAAVGGFFFSSFASGFLLNSPGLLLLIFVLTGELQEVGWKRLLA